MNQLEAKKSKLFKSSAAMRFLFKRIENQLGGGTPDAIGTNRTGGVAWIEFKALEYWPKRPATLPLARKFEKGQLPFLKEWISWGGNGFVILCAEDEFYLLDPKLELQSLTKSQLENSAIAVGIEQCITHLECLI